MFDFPEITLFFDSLAFPDVISFKQELSKILNILFFQKNKIKKNPLIWEISFLPQPYLGDAAPDCGPHAPSGCGSQCHTKRMWPL